MENSMPLLPEMGEIWQKTLGWQPTTEQQDLLQKLYQGVVAGNRQLNLTRITEPEAFWEKHLWDSLAGIQSLDLNKGKIIDIGTGAGFPGLPVAIAAPMAKVVLLDSTRKKIDFLQDLISQLPINNARAVVGRAEKVGQQSSHRETYDLVLIRAVGHVCACAEYSLPLLKIGGQAVLYRGNWNEDQQEETALQIAVEKMGGEIITVTSLVTPLSNSLRNNIYLRKIAPTPSQFPRRVGIPNKKPLGMGSLNTK